MKRCPITYASIAEDARYSSEGLKLLSRGLLDLKPLPLTAHEQRLEAASRAGKMSIQGVQPKLSAILNASSGSFDIVDIGSRYILKPQCDFAELPENEAITMTLASEIGMEVPLHGLLYSKDGSYTYFIRRFDRGPRGTKFHVEDLAQITGESRDTKYASTMERVAKAIEECCTFPLIEHAKLFRLTVFSYLIGNEDMHLKNFSVIMRDGKVELSPAYDLVNSTIVLRGTREELALPLNGKKANLKRSDLVDYFGKKRLGLNTATIDDILSKISRALPKWRELIGKSFMSESMKEKYLAVMGDRCKRLGV